MTYDVDHLTIVLRTLASLTTPSIGASCSGGSGGVQLSPEVVTNDPESAWFTAAKSSVFLTLTFMGGLQSSVPCRLHSRTKADGQQSHPAEEEAMVGAVTGRFRHLLGPSTRRFHYISLPEGPACLSAAEVRTLPQGWAMNVLTIRTLPHNKALHLGFTTLVHPSCSTCVGKKAQRREAMCLTSHSSQGKTSTRMTFQFNGSRTRIDP
ncbi:uncharacterized protein LOC121011910 isoform X1 [Herpailurus yagouaroundi]|uniref:uncharacterized protein LOC121011910 isoform X1 n=1 Tax=Herpailurus yagouaroundi TaxID=1608482 RepID=UPI001AD643CF|nr:uncharacterized protein LOC121011910 isoform X1 [Puma yagouaroundi]XP_040302647.1 uncharacterized protein LOC121011910 isoform X1 [Puma yagouaroundi]